jgi:lipopolysaccharide/colanic/teichoic acid biosynthesis glycosyltransferase
MLVLISCEDFRVESGSTLVDDVVAAVSSNTRETDVLGWYERDVTLGLLMTEIGQADNTSVETIMQKIADVLRRAVSSETYHRLTLQFRVFPQQPKEMSDEETDLILYPDLSKKYETSKHGYTLKRIMDIIGSLLAIILFLPVFLLIASFVKMTSKGPVLFRQKRVGQHGRQFTFLKFRTMFAGNDPCIHREYVAKLIAGADDVGQGKGVYKLINDPRITPLGRFLRKTSLDELPQFINVLMNDMSLVGPRPPLPYEYERYQTWHKRRVLELKPGLTGLWQIEGRSRTTFDEMVRMDLRYAHTRSVWVDLKILLQTPAAMFSGRGAC